MNDKLKPWLWLTLPMAVLIAIASGAGFFVEDLYRLDSPAYAIQGIGQDLVTLIVAVPTLAISAWFAGRGSNKGLLVWLGVAAYMLYSYIMYAFTVRFNALFLVYCLSMGLSLYALIGGLSAVDASAIMESITARKDEVRLRKVIAGFLLLITAMFYFLWLSEVIPHTLAGTTPPSLQEIGLPTNPVHIMDLAVLLPALIITGVFLLRKKPLGFVLAPLFLVFTITLALALASMVVFMVQVGYASDMSVAVIFSVLAVLSIGLTAYYFRGLN